MDVNKHTHKKDVNKTHGLQSLQSTIVVVIYRNESTHTKNNVDPLNGEAGRKEISDTHSRVKAAIIPC